ncbi:MAG TPA: hypothetical protein VFU22_26700 [Roseiflexaceae bacterium]|nr:hypothetical protein [Roseiflexaceae bacterium]
MSVLLYVAAPAAQLHLVGDRRRPTDRWVDLGLEPIVIGLPERSVPLQLIVPPLSLGAPPDALRLPGR